jgi:hypothetical protein
MRQCYHKRVRYNQKAMRKEVILAVIIGVILGGVILYGINLANSSSNLNSDETNQDGNGNQNTPTATKKSENSVTVIFPQNNAVVTEAQLTLKGTAKANSNVAIITESDDILTVSDSAGNFSSPINLINGENMITVTAVDEKLATTSASISVIRTTTLPE